MITRLIVLLCVLRAESLSTAQLRVVERFRLVPVGRTTSDTTEWTVEVVPTISAGRAIQIMVARSHGETTIDSVLFDRKTLAPIWEHARGPASFAVDYTDSRVIGHTRRPDGTVVSINVPSPGHAYSSTMDNRVVRALPLAAGYRKALPFWDGNHVEIDTVRVRVPSTSSGDQQPATTSVVDFVEPYATETLWVDRRSHRVLSHVYTWKRDGSTSTVVSGGGPSDFKRSAGDREERM